MNAKHDHPSADGAPGQALSPRDGALLAVLVTAMTAASVAGQRAAMYACFAATGGWLIVRLAAQRRARPAAAAGGSFGGRMRWALEATPAGYRLGLAGLAVAVVGLLGDIVWHSVLGTEAGIARVIAPFHLLLFTGAGLLLTSPVRAAWASTDYNGRLSLRKALPLLLGLTLLIALALFVFQWLSAFGDWKPSVDAAALPLSARTDEGVVQSLQTVVVARVIVTDLILLAPALLAVRRFRLPFGAITLMFTVAASLSAALSEFALAGSLLAALAAGLVADGLVRRLRPSMARPDACRVFALVTSLAFAASYLVAVAVIYGRTLPLDLALGTIGLTGLAGLALSLVAVPPAAAPDLPEEEETSADETSAPATPVRRRPRHQADVRFAAQVTGSSASRQHAVGAISLCALLQGATPTEVVAAFEPPLTATELVGLCCDVADLHRAWATQPLRQHDVVYLFLEAVSLPGPKETAADLELLGAWGITRHGKRVLLGLRTGSHDRGSAWSALGADLVERGMNAPAIVVSDGAPGVWRVIDELWPDAATQHCVRHALTDAGEGLGDDDRRQFRSRFRAVLESARSSAEATRQLEEVLDDYRETAPAHIGVLAQRLDRITAHLAFPGEHRRVLRSATVLERALAPLRTGRGPARQLPGRVSAPALVWAVLDNGSTTTRRLPMPLHAAAQLDQLRRKQMPISDASGTPEA